MPIDFDRADADASANPDQVRAKTMMTTAPEPEAGASALRFGPQAGVSPDVAAYNPSFYKQQAQGNQQEADIQRSPPLANYLASRGPAVAAAAKPYTGNLADLGNQFIQQDFTKPLQDTFNAGSDAWKALQRDADRAQSSYANHDLGQFAKSWGSIIADAVGVPGAALTVPVRNTAGMLAYLPENEKSTFNPTDPWQLVQGWNSLWQRGDLSGMGGAATSKEALDSGPASYEERVQRWEQRFSIAALLASPEAPKIQFKTRLNMTPEEMDAYYKQWNDRNVRSNSQPGDIEGTARDVTAESGPQLALPKPYDNSPAIVPEAEQAIRGNTPDYNKGLWNTTDLGFVADSAGEPVTFTSEQAATSWANELGNAGNHNQVFAPVEGPEGWHVQQTSTLEPPVEGVPPVGASPAVDAVRAALAHMDYAAISDLTTMLKENPAFSATPELITDFLHHISPTMVTVDTWMMGELEIPQIDQMYLASKMGVENPQAALESGSINLPLAKYLMAVAGSPHEQTMHELTVFRPDGLSVSAAKEPVAPPDTHAWPAVIPGPEFQAGVAPGQTSEPAEFLAATMETAKTYLSQEERSQHLKQIFTEAKAIGMNKEQFAKYSEQTKIAQQVAYERMLAHVEAEIKKTRTQDYQYAFQRNFQNVHEEIMTAPHVKAYMVLKDSGAEPTGAVLPEDFYHGTTHVSIGEKDAQGKIVNPWSLGTRGGISFSDNQEFASNWSGNMTNSVVYIAKVRSLKHADFRNPKDVAAVAKWYKKHGWEDEEYNKRELAHGNWSMWENQNMLKDLGFDSVRMREYPTTEGDPRHHTNIFVTNADNIAFKYVGFDDPEGFKLDEKERKNFAHLTLPKGLFAKGGMSADQAANVFGFDSGAELMEALAQLEMNKGDKSIKAYIAAEIRKEAVRRAMGDIGVSLAPEDIQAAAQEAVANPEAKDLLLAELKVLHELNGTPFNKDQLVLEAERQFGLMPVSDALSLKKFEQAVYSQGTKAERYWMNGKYVEALDAKQKQFLSLAKLQASHSFQKVYAKAMKQWSKWAKAETISGMNQKYLNYIHEALKGMEYNINRDWDELQKNIGGIHLNEFIVMKNAGENMSLAVGKLTFGDPKDMAVGQFRINVDSLKSIAKNGENEANVYAAGKTAELAAITKDVAYRADLYGRKFNPVDVRDRAKEHPVAHVLSWADAMQLRFETYIKELDLADYGPLNMYIVRELEKAKYDLEDLKRLLTTELKALNEKLPKDYYKQLEQSASIPLVDSEGNNWFKFHGNIVAAALNMGNESNFRKFVVGYNFAPQAAAHHITNALTADDLVFVQGVFNIFEKLWPLIEAHALDLSGVAPPKIKPTPIVTPLGTIPGGYYPVHWERSVIGKTDDAPRDPSQPTDESLFGGTFIPAVPQHNWELARTDFAAPISLEFRNLPTHLENIALDLAYRKPLLQAWRILRQPEIKRAIQDTLGPEISAQVYPTLQYLARRKLITDSATGPLANLVRKVRAASVFWAVNSRISTIMLHGPIALSHSISSAGLGEYTAAVYDMLRSPASMRQAVDLVNSKSQEVALAWAAGERDVRQAFDMMAGKPGTGWKTFEQVGFKMLGIVSQLSSYPLWLAVYKTQMKISPLDEERAIALADEAVRVTHGAAQSVDLPAYLRENGSLMGEFGQLATTLMGFLNTAYNKMWQMRQKIGRMVGGGYGKPPPPPEGYFPAGGSDAPKPPNLGADARDVFSNLLWFILTPSIIFALRETAKKDTKNKTQWLDVFERGMIDGLLENTVGTMPGGRELVQLTENVLAGQRPMNDNTVDDVATAFAGTAHNLLELGEHLANKHHKTKLDSKWIVEAAEAFTYAASEGKIPGQFATDAQVLWNNAHPTNRSPRQTPANEVRQLIMGSTSSPQYKKGK